MSSLQKQLLLLARCSRRSCHNRAGSNDVANAFGTSGAKSFATPSFWLLTPRATVGSGTLTLKQAVLVAIVFEFTGAMVLGRVVTDTSAWI